MTTYTLSKAPASFAMHVIDNDDMFTAQNGAIWVQARTGNRWMLNATWRVYGTAMQAFSAEIDQLMGKRHRLLVPMSKLKYTRRGVGGGTPLVNGAHSAGATTLSLKSLPNTVTGILQPNDYIQVGNQLVRATSILTSSGTTGSCSIRPELHKNYSDGASVNYATPGGVFILMVDPDVGYNVDLMAEIQAQFVEDVLA
jgi:hypothetical protein